VNDRVAIGSARFKGLQDEPDRVFDLVPMPRFRQVRLNALNDSGRTHLLGHYKVTQNVTSHEDQQDESKGVLAVIESLDKDTDCVGCSAGEI
jgi:hypothetical protein